MHHNKAKKKEIDEFIKAHDEWEPVGPTPMPDITTLRGHHLRLLETYKPFYAPFCDLCCRCTFGKCDLSGDKKGACGITLSTQQSREFLMSCCMGVSAHAAHGGHLLDYLIEKFGADHKIDLGPEVLIEMPVMRTLIGLKPETLADLKKSLDYVNDNIVHLVASCHTGQEGGHLDYESKAMHAGLMDMLAMEISDVCQISALDMPRNCKETSLVDIGWKSAERSKPTILCVGHNVSSSKELIDYLQANDLYDKVEVGGICCTAIDNTRYSDRAKVIGPLSRQLFYVRSGLADVIVTDEQCIRCDLPGEAKKAESAFIATSDKVSYGLENVTDKGSDEIVRMIVEEGKQVLLLDPLKIGEVAAKVALEMVKKRRKDLVEASQVQELAKACKKCGICNQVCANLLPVQDAVQAAAAGDLGPLKRIYQQCIGCGKCDQECREEVPIIKMMQAVADPEIYKMRVGRGAAHELEIRFVGTRLGLGEIPCVLAFVGCSNFPEEEDIADMVEEFAKRKYLVLLTGCSAMAAAMKKDKDGKNVYERYPGEFVPGGVVNIGSCVANAHIGGLAIKVAQVFAKLPLRANFEVMADYILNRVPAVGVAWGAYSQKATSIASGCNALGIPVVLGPHSSKYRRVLISDDSEADWTVMDARTKVLRDAGEASPVHLLTVVESKERAMVTIAKLAMRRNDTELNRNLKLFHYIDLHMKYMGTFPPDLGQFVRRPSDIPLVYRRQVMKLLKSMGWEPREGITSPTLIGTYQGNVTVEQAMASQIK